MPRPLRLAAGLVALASVAGLAACGRQPAPVSDDLQRDLDLASTSGVELAPRPVRTDVVSAIELGQRAAPPPAATPARQTARVRTPRPPVAERVAAPVEETPVIEAPTVEAPAAEETAPVAEAPAPVVTRAPEPARAPLPMPSRAPGRRNGGWTTADVIRNAPFPINP